MKCCWCGSYFEICCDYGVCMKEMDKRFVKGTANPTIVAAWISENLKDAQEDECEEGDE